MNRVEFRRWWSIANLVSKTSTPFGARYSFRPIWIGAQMSEEFCDYLCRGTMNTDVGEGARLRIDVGGGFGLGGLLLLGIILKY